jgi:hypothetical protein
MKATPHKSALFFPDATARHRRHQVCVFFLDAVDVQIAALLRYKSNKPIEGPEGS